MKNSSVGKPRPRHVREWREAQSGTVRIDGGGVLTSLLERHAQLLSADGVRSEREALSSVRDSFAPELHGGAEFSRPVQQGNIPRAVAKRLLIDSERRGEIARFSQRPREFSLVLDATWTPLRNCPELCERRFAVSVEPAGTPQRETICVAIRISIDRATEKLDRPESRPAVKLAQPLIEQSPRLGGRRAAD
jgi:hypothetical protein